MLCPSDGNAIFAACPSAPVRAGRWHNAVFGVPERRVCCVQTLQDVEGRAAASEQQASAREQELQAQVAGLRAEAWAREESAAALEARLQEALDSVSSAAVDRRRLEAKLQQHSQVFKHVGGQCTDIVRSTSSCEAPRQLSWVGLQQWLFDLLGFSICVPAVGTIYMASPAC